jgi:hypothetical protein
MAYRNGTYVAFHAGGTSDPTASDMRYYQILTAWHENDSVEFRMVNSHEKTSAVRDSSKKETLKRSLRERLNNSRNVLLILTMETKNDIDWVPFEIAYAVDTCEIPIIAAYPDEGPIFQPRQMEPYWPAALKNRINSGSAKVMHIPFAKEPIKNSLSTFGPERYPAGGSLGWWTAEAYRKWGYSV